MTDQALNDGFTPQELEEALEMASWAGELFAIRLEADLDALSATRGVWSVLVTRSGAKIIHKDHGMRQLDIEAEVVPEDPDVPLEHSTEDAGC